MAGKAFGFNNCGNGHSTSHRVAQAFSQLQTIPSKGSHPLDEQCLSRQLITSLYAQQHEHFAWDMLFLFLTEHTSRLLSDGCF